MIETTDWNWFFSSIAQAAAAIVGIFGAFTITKVLNSQAQFEIKCASLQDAMLSSQRLEESNALEHIRWFIHEFDGSALNHKVTGLLNQVENEGDLKDPEDYYQQVEFSGFSSKEDLIERIKELISQKREALKKDGAARYLPGGVRMVSEGYQPERERKTESIRKYILDVHHQVKRNQTLLAELKHNPESSSLVTYSILSILVLFYAGVIYPLSFMPLPLNAELVLTIGAFWDVLFSLRGAILTLIAVVFSLLLIIFLLINVRLKYERNELLKLERYCSIENYNQLLKNMVANRYITSEIGVVFGGQN